MLQEVGTLIEGRPLESVYGNTTVKDALVLMVEKDYSQLPVINVDLAPWAQTVGGLFTQRKLMSLIDAQSLPLSALLERPVSDFMETPATTISKGASIHDAARLLGQDDVVAIIVEATKYLDGVGDIVEAIGIVTDYDINKFLVRWSEGIALIESIEKCLREIVEHVLYTPEKLQAALCRVFGTDKSDPSKPARAYDELTLWEQQQLIADDKVWPQFAPYLQSKETFTGFMRAVRPIRNQVAHFRGDLTQRQRRHLRDAREWIALRAKPGFFSDDERVKNMPEPPF